MTGATLDFSDARQALLKQRLEGKLAQTAGFQHVPRRSESGPAPLSLQQYRLWFLEQLATGTASNNVDVALNLDFALDTAVLERSLNEIVRRHEALRTRFVSIDGRPMQVVAPELRLRVPMVDLSHLPLTVAEAKALELATEEAREPFDLATGPLLRALVVRLAPLRWVLALTMHHIVSDGWSLRLMFKELAQLYEAFATGRPSPLPELEIQYADFAVWQREHLAGARLERQLDYWRTQLAELPVLDLPTDRPRPPIQSFEGATHTFAVPTGLATALRKLGQDAGATLFMTLLTGFAALMGRYSGQTDLPLGTYMSGRTRVELESLIGFFVNTLVLRVDIAGDPTFGEALGRVREVALAAYANQDVPFEQLVETLAPARDPSRNPLCQVAFQFLTGAGGPRANGPAAASTQLEVDRGASTLDLVWSMIEGPDGNIFGKVEYNTGLFDPASIEGMAERYCMLLQAGVDHPARALNDVDLTSPADRERLEQWNDTAVPVPSRSLAELFAQQVAATPAAEAVRTGDGDSISFSELDRRANHLAARLVGQGVATGTLVGVLLERSIDWVVCCVAIAKAGGAYLPLDPSWPEQRLGYMFTNSGASLLLTNRTAAAALLEHASARLLLDDLDDGDAPDPGSPAVGVSPADLAYVVYTSGSTGLPKGVAVDYSVMLNRLHWMWRAYPFQPGEMGALSTPTSFVDSMWEVWGPLLAGVPALVVPTAVRTDPRALIDLLARHKVTRLWLVPSLLNAMVDADPALGEHLPSLRMWVVSGEALTPQLAERFHAAAPSATLYNLYGISEVWDATWQPCAPGASIVPIGKPIDNVRCHVLDARLQEVPIGLPGELCIGGAGLARGYLGDAELTASRFIEHPAEGGGRLYRTGDRVRWLADGALEFLGRVDNQVKVRGVRVELGEVEAVLGGMPDIAQAAVAAWPDAATGHRLVAYVVPSPGRSITFGAVRLYLGQHLTDPMIPTGLVLLDRLPRTPSGKLDRRALPPSQVQREGDVAAPRNALEQVLASVWSDVLKVPALGIDDNFFELGGHSLLVTQIVSRIEDLLEINLPLQEFFRLPTVASLAEGLLSDPVRGPAIQRAAEVVIELMALSDEDVEARLRSDLATDGEIPR